MAVKMNNYFPGCPEQKRAQYNYGLEIGSKAKYISIGQNNVWSARMEDDSHLGSYEKIGYHVATIELLQGMWNTGCPIVVHRAHGNTYTWGKNDDLNNDFEELLKLIVDGV